MKCKVSKFKKHNFCDTDNSEVATRCPHTHTHTKKKATLKNSAILTGKDPRWTLSTINLQALRCATLSKRDAKAALPHAYCEIPKNTHSEEHLRKAASDN